MQNSLFEQKYSNPNRLLLKKDLLKQFPWTQILIWPFVETSYREPNDSYLRCWQSLFEAHNESVNCWTHIFGFAWTCYLFSIRRKNSKYDTTVVVIYLFTALAVFMFSSSYHLFCCHSERVCRKVLCLDWMVISTLIFSSNLLSSYFELFEYPMAFAIFMSFNVILICTTSFITFSSLQNMFGFPKLLRSSTSEFYLLRKLSGVLSSYTFRTLTYVLYASGVMIAWAIHFTIGVNNPLETSTLNGILLMYACYASVLLCIFHLPERLVPQGTVDIFGFSHQIFHVGVIGGVTALFWTYN